MDKLELSPKGTMRNLPPVPSFIVFSRSGAVLRSVPSNYDQVPINTIFIALHVFFMNGMNFGDVWKLPQSKVFSEYYRVEEQTFRLTVIEKAIREYVSTGKIARRPPFAFSDYLPPLYALWNSRFLESQTLFGISPLPVASDSTSWKILNQQNVISTLSRLQLLIRNANQHLLIIREILRRLMKNFKSLNLPNGNINEIQEKNSNILVAKLVYTLMCTIARPAQKLQSEFGDDFAKGMYFLFKQSRIGLRQLSLASQNPNDKFFKRMKQQFQQSLNQDRVIENQYWFKYRNFIFREPIGIKQKFDFRFKDDQTVDGVLPPGLAKNPIKLSKQSLQNSSKYALDLFSITEKLHFNKSHIQNDGINLKLNSLFQSLVKVNKSVQMISKGNVFYKNVHMNPNEERLSSDDEITFMNKFVLDAIPMYLIQPVVERQKKNDNSNEVSSARKKQSEKKEQIV
ncbi:MAG: hypothetical protein EZS28_040601, partial [Streblomastix strix]